MKHFPIQPIRRIAVTREEAADMREAHAEGWHTLPEGLPRDGCPDCMGRPLRTYPTAASLERRNA